MLGEPVAGVAEPVGEPRRSSELCKAADPGVAVVTGDKSRTESGITRRLCVWLRTGGYQPADASGVNPTRQAYWVPLKPAVLADGVDCSTGAAGFTMRLRLIWTRLTGCDAWAAPSIQV